MNKERERERKREGEREREREREREKLRHHLKELNGQELTEQFTENNQHD